MNFLTTTTECSPSQRQAGEGNPAIRYAVGATRSFSEVVGIIETEPVISSQSVHRVTAPSSIDDVWFRCPIQWIIRPIGPCDRDVLPKALSVDRVRAAGNPGRDEHAE